MAGIEVLDDVNSRLKEANLRQAAMQLKLVEDQLDMYDRLVDMSDITRFGDEPAGAGSQAVDAMIGWQLAYPGSFAVAMRNETDRRTIVARSRVFAMTNPYALGAQENRINYTVGRGHTYKVSQVDPDADDGVDDDTLSEVRDIIDEFCCENQWSDRQEETIRRLDRDGERFLRFFSDGGDGILRVRFVEPLLVQTPVGEVSDPWTFFGIKFKKGDIETPVAYWVTAVDARGIPIPGSEEKVDAKEIQHLKANVDMASPRGIPIWWALQTHLASAVRTLSNMGKLVEFRTRIGMIRKHVKAAQQTIQNYVAAQSGLSASNPDGTSRTLLQYPQAAVIDTSDNTEYDFPGHNTQVDTIVAAIQAELRAASAALTMPEYMLSGDASNANFASTMVAEGPAVKGFERMQSRLIAADLKVIRKAISVAAPARGLPEDILDLVKIEAEPPIIKSENRLQETQADKILLDGKVMSRQTFAARNGLEYEDEKNHIEEEAESEVGYGGVPGQMPPAFGPDGRPMPAPIGPDGKPAPAEDPQKMGSSSGA